MDKPGIKTTEFWLSSVAAICGVLMTGGFFADDSVVVRVAGAVATVLASLGYTWSRTVTKGGKK